MIYYRHGERHRSRHGADREIYRRQIYEEGRSKAALEGAVRGGAAMQKRRRSPRDPAGYDRGIKSAKAALPAKRAKKFLIKFWR